MLSGSVVSALVSCLSSLPRRLTPPSGAPHRLQLSRDMNAESTWVDNLLGSPALRSYLSVPGVTQQLLSGVSMGLNE